MGTTKIRANLTEEEAEAEAEMAEAETGHHGIPIAALKMESMRCAALRSNTAKAGRVLENMPSLS